MEKTITVYFEDQFHNTDTTKIPVIASDKDSFNVEAEDVATEWYYSVAAKMFLQTWDLYCDDMDYEYSGAFDSYLANCIMNWEISEDD